MKIGVLGTGMVGNAIATKLVALGHDVKMGARSATNEKATAWAKDKGLHGSHGAFADAALHGQIVFNCTAGAISLDVVKAAGIVNLRDKVLIDVSNPLDFSRGFPPSSIFRGEDSTGEQLQRHLPGTSVVKTLNTVNCKVMVEPSRVPGDHDVFVAGDDAASKARVSEILTGWFGWKTVVDLGGINAARGLEAYGVAWVHLFRELKTADFNIKIVR